jgi:gamma-glutamylcyclotransferase (GGCT)/AIG2-like uncharacterized protein YtfP
MFPEVWRAIVGREFHSMEGAISGFAIYRVANAVYPGLVPAPQAHAVRGVVYLDVDEESVERLDRFEGNFYERVSVWTDGSDGQRRAAEAYVVPPCNQAMLTSETWERDTFLASGGLDQFIGAYPGFARIEKRV